MLVVDQHGAEVDRIVGFRPPKDLILALNSILDGKSFGAYQKRVTEDPDDLEAVLGLAEKYQERRSFDKAEKLYKRVLEKENAPPPARVTAQGGLAVIGFYKSRGTEIAPLEKFFRQNAKSDRIVEPAQLLFQYYQRSEETEKLVKVGDYLVRHRSDDAETLNNYAWYLATHDVRLKRAQKLAQKAVKLSPESAHIVDTLAEAYFRNGRLEDAVKTAEKAVALASDRQREQFKERLQSFRKALEKSTEAGRKF